MPVWRTAFANIFEYWLKETFSAPHLQLKSTDTFFANWHRVDFSDIPLARRRELFVEVAEWWGSYNCSRLLYAPTAVVFA